VNKLQGKKTYVFKALFSVRNQRKMWWSRLWVFR